MSNNSMEQGDTINTITTTQSANRWMTFERMWSVAVLSLIAATWKLWFGNHDFPAVPLLPLPNGFLRLDFFVVLSLVGILAYLAISQRYSFLTFSIVFIGLVVAFIFNQHRLQPWAYQAAIQCLVLASLPRHAARAYLIVLSISIYFFSACGKFDYQFLHTVGQDFISVLVGPSRGEPSRTRLLLAAGLPASELAIAAGLCFATTRRYAGLAAMLMHATLIAVLGPWHLAHSTGVVLWNAWLIAQAWFLFVFKPDAGASASIVNEAVKPPFRFGQLVAKIVVFAAIYMPFFERAGYWDHWLSWSLYSPHTSRAAIQVHRIVLDSLPESSRPFAAEVDGEDNWHSLAIDRWSIRSLGVPVYPQARFQLGIARSISRSISDHAGIRVQIRSSSDRWTGSRKENWLLGRDEIETAADDFLFLGE